MIENFNKPNKLRSKYYLKWAGSLSNLAFNTIYGKILRISSAHAALIPSSVEKNENVVSSILKQLKMQADFVFGDRHLSMPYNSLIATSQSYLLL